MNDVEAQVMGVSPVILSETNPDRIRELIERRMTSLEKNGASMDPRVPVAGSLAVQAVDPVVNNSVNMLINEPRKRGGMGY